MDTSFLTSQVAGIIAQLHGLFDEIGVPSHERDSREAELFKALSESLHNHLRRVTAEKNDMTEEAHRIIKVIKQMETSLDDTHANHDNAVEDRDLRVSYPLTRCLQMLNQKHAMVSKLHKERFEQVKKLVQALESYSSHLEPSFVRIALPSTSPNASISPTFDLSPTYVAALDQEFTRVFETYTRRVANVKDMAEEVVRLWAELGTPQAQTDDQIVRNHKDSPEQLGLHEADLQRLSGIRQNLLREKSDRERRLKELKLAVEALWDRLGVEQPERKRFLNGNRGCGLRVMNEFEDELARLNELKRQNLHLFVEDARYRLQELWDSLYFSEEEMLEFTPAFSDVYSDALLSSHEAEIGRLEALKEQRAPILQMIDRHRSLIKDRDDLATSSQDASRLMARGQTGQRRDPTRLLREEKMRKRIAKELPKLEADLKKVLEDWEDEYGRPFCVLGESYLDELEALSASRAAVPPRSKTPSVAPPSHKSSKSVPTIYPSRPGSSMRGLPPPRSGAKTPTGTGSSTIRRNPLACSTTSTVGGHTPSKIPARVPLGNMPHGNNSPERGMGAGLAQEKVNLAVGSKPAQSLMAPPPKMRNLVSPFSGPSSVGPTGNHYEVESARSDSAASSRESVKNMPPEDIYGDRAPHSYLHSTSSMIRSQPNQAPSSKTMMVSSSSTARGQDYLQHSSHDYHHHHEVASASSYAASSASSMSTRPESRQISVTSSGTTNTNTNTVSGSENWETYDDNSDLEPEPEPDASEAYLAKLRAARNKRFTPDPGYSNSNTTYTGSIPAGHGHGHGHAGVGVGTGVVGAGYGPGAGGKKIKGIRSPGPQPSQKAATTTMMMMEGGGGGAGGAGGGRMIAVSGSDAGWTDEDAF